MSLFGGALADRIDRRRLLLVDQLALVAISARAGGLRALAGIRRCALLYLLAGLLAGFGAVQNVARGGDRPERWSSPEQLRGALALNFGLYQLTMVIGPGSRRPADRRELACRRVYTIDAVSCLGMVASACWRWRPSRR